MPAEARPSRVKILPVPTHPGVSESQVPWPLGSSYSVLDTGTRSIRRIAVSNAGNPESYRVVSGVATSVVHWRHNLQLQRFAQSYAKAASTIPEVARVVLDVANSTIWTLLDRRPFDRAVRNLVYEFEEETANQYVGVTADFRLANLAEIPAAKRQDVLSLRGNVIYERG